MGGLPNPTSPKAESADESVARLKSIAAPECWPKARRLDAVLCAALKGALSYAMARKLEGCELADAAMADQWRDGDLTRLQVVLVQAVHAAQKSGPRGSFLSSMCWRVAAVALLRVDLEAAIAHLQIAASENPGDGDAPALLRFALDSQRAQDEREFARASQKPSTSVARPPARPKHV